jgi:hypothetical protein
MDNRDKAHVEAQHLEGVNGNYSAAENPALLRVKRQSGKQLGSAGELRLNL